MNLENIINEKIDKKSVIPIYYQIAKLFERKIYAGELKPGEKLPPENKIANIFDISRMTVRKALSELIDANMVYSEKGKGTFVAKPKLDNTVFELKNFKEELINRGLNPKTKLLNVKIIRADQDLANKLNIKKGIKCLDFNSIISANNEPLIYESKYIVYSKHEPILEKEIQDPSLSNIAMSHGDSFPIMSKKILNVSKVSKKHAKLLNLKEKSPVFVIEQYLYDSNNNPIGWGKSICRGDKFRFTSYSGWSKEKQNF